MKYNVVDCEIVDYFIGCDNIQSRVINRYTNIVDVKTDTIYVNLYDGDIFFDRQENVKDYCLFDVYQHIPGSFPEKKKVFSVIAVDYPFVYKFIEDNNITNEYCYLKRRNASIKL